MNLESGRIDRNKCRNTSNLMKHHIFQNKSILKILIFCLPVFILLSGSAFAIEDTLIEKDTGRLNSKHNFEISAVYNYFEYSEPEVDIDITGFMAGIKGKYTFCSTTGFIFSAELEYTYGLNTEYDGATWAGTPLNEDSKDWIVEPRLLTGGRLKLDEHFIINPYFGLGARYWHNDIDGSGSYRRKTEYLYLPVGTNVTYKVSENFKWGVNLEFDIFLWGQNRSYLSDSDPGFNDVKLDQDSGYG
ncbi:MAG: outer membrane beta-barrel protein [Desulfobacterium sp.]|nr:outer membrane beta-barrel protein [Desulfobacterium sp.]MBU4035785.1 outer membrane beta-barrel protein [Pseudomonadota bacterium]